MAIAGYTKTTYVNDTTPAINATNLNNIEQQVKDISDASVNGGASPTKIWTDTNDGNAGQPPAPKPNQTSSSTPGFFDIYFVASGANLVVPSGGTWTFEVTTPYGGYFIGQGIAAGVVAGGTTLTNASGNLNCRLYKKE